jgi:hypothetical protein
VVTPVFRDRIEGAVLQLVRVAPGPPPRLLPAEWDAVVALAAYERVAPLLWAAVAGQRDEVPPPARDALEASFRQSAAAAARILPQAAALQRILRAASVDGLLWKGAALACSAYSDPGLRPFSDIDLLVRAGDVPAVHAALRQAGYAIVGDEPTEADLTWRHGRAYFDPQGGRVPVDVHWRYLGYPLQVALDYDAIVRRAVPVEINGEPGRMPAPADHVVALAVAYLREVWYGKPRLRYLRDVAAVAREPLIAWESILAAAADAPLLRTPLCVTLAAAARLGAAVPPEIIDRLRPRGRLARSLIARAGATMVRRERPAAAVLQVGIMRWLDGGLPALREWLRNLRFIPAPLAGGRRRWWRHLWQG